MALKNTLAATLQTAQPTLLRGAARVGEDLGCHHEKDARDAGLCAEARAHRLAQGVNLRAYYAKQLGGDMVCSLALALADRMPTSTATLEFWGALGVGTIEV